MSSAKRSSGHGAPIRDGESSALRSFVFAGVLVAAALVPRVAFADRGALTLDFGGGGNVEFVSAPYVATPAATLTTKWNLELGARYALSHSFEIGVAAQWEPPVDVFHSNVSVPDGVYSGVLLPGQLQHSLERRSAWVSARYMQGMIWRLTVGLNAGWTQRLLSRFHHVDMSVSGRGQEYNVRFEPVTANYLLIAPTVGVEWAVNDHWSVSVLPRVDVLIGAQPTVALTVPIVWSWSWYL